MGRIVCENSNKIKTVCRSNVASFRPGTTVNNDGIVLKRLKMRGVRSKTHKPGPGSRETSAVAEKSNSAAQRNQWARGGVKMVGQ